jgi:membrane-associated phospholipid phosphatase
VIRIFRFRAISFLLLGSATATALLLVNERQGLRATGPGAIIFVLAALLCIGLRFWCHRPPSEARRIIRDLAEYVGIFGLICMIGAVASYPDAAASVGMVDPLLQRADQLLHFDWVGLYLFVAEHRSLQILGAWAYQSIYFSPAVLLGYFAWADRSAEAHRFLLSFWLAALITLVLFRWLPAAGPFAYLWHGPIPYMPSSALYQAELIPSLQQHALPLVDLDELHGLVSAPSFHAASGMLYILFARRVPRLGAPLIALNLTMLAATPVEGTHYLIDVISGVIVAWVAWGLVMLTRFSGSSRRQAAGMALAHTPAA